MGWHESALEHKQNATNTTTIWSTLQTRRGSRLEPTNSPALLEEKGSADEPWGCGGFFLWSQHCTYTSRSHSTGGSWRLGRSSGRRRDWTGPCRRFCPGARVWIRGLQMLGASMRTGWMAPQRSRCDSHSFCPRTAPTCVSGAGATRSQAAVAREGLGAGYPIKLAPWVFRVVRDHLGKIFHDCRRSFVFSLLLISWCVQNKRPTDNLVRWKLAVPHPFIYRAQALWFHDEDDAFCACSNLIRTFLHLLQGPKVRTAKFRYSAGVQRPSGWRISKKPS
jgi:hypothetical protein